MSPASRLPRALLRLAVTVIAALAAAAPVLASGELLHFDAQERALIASHGPWPPHRERDPTNRVSGHAGAVAIGRKLFFDPRLSGAGSVSCAHCHDPARAFTDRRARAQGIGPLDRNTPTLLDLAGQRWFGWDGGTDSLWAANVRPILAASEMGGSARGVAQLIEADPRLGAQYHRVFGPPASDARLLADTGKALAAYVETLRSPRTAFDRFRDALLRGDRQAAARYPVAAQRGLKLFIGEGRCSTCHTGPRFSNGEFHDIGIRFMPAPGRVDPGRFAGLQRLLADPYNLLGPFNDQGRQQAAGQTGDQNRHPGEAAVDRATATRTVTLQHRNWGEWKTPGLRGLSTSAPYMHDGSIATLREVIRHYSELDIDRLHADGEALLRPLRLDAAQTDDLLAFLATLDPEPAPAREARASARPGRVK